MEPHAALPLTASPAAWLITAMANLDAVHRDHVHCERKAAQSALSLMRSYPELDDVSEAMARLAHEETRHVIQVAALVTRRGGNPGYDHGDEYAARLRVAVRKQEPARLLDRLLVFGIIEGRSAERLGLLADALAHTDADPRTAALYRSLADAEIRHRDRFLGLAQAHRHGADVGARAAELCALEASIIAELPVVARIH